MSLQNEHAIHLRQHSKHWETIKPKRRSIVRTSSAAVENNGCLAVKQPKAIKLAYAETVRTKATVEVQNRLIMNGLDLTNDLDETYVLNKVDIKKK